MNTAYVIGCLVDRIVAAELKASAETLRADGSQDALAKQLRDDVANSSRIALLDSELKQTKDNLRIEERRAEVLQAEAQNYKVNNLPKLAELWEAARDVSEFSIPGEALTRLRKALDASSDICDQIPF